MDKVKYSMIWEFGIGSSWCCGGRGFPLPFFYQNIFIAITMEHLLLVHIQFET